MLAAGGALAGRLAAPGEALAALAGSSPPSPSLGECRLGALPPGERTLALAHNADLIGVSWRGRAAARGARVQLRFRAADGRWADWASAAAGAHGPDERRPAATAAIVGEPVWTGGTRVVQLRSDRSLADARLHL